MGSSSVNEVSTFGRTSKSDNEGERGLEQFLGFPVQLVSYLLGSDAFRKFCKAKAAVARLVKGIWLGIDEEKSERKKDEEAKVVGVMDSLDGVSHQTVVDNQRDNVKLPEGRSEKVVREMSLRINDLESGLAKERVTFKALLSTCDDLNERVARLKVEKDQAIARTKKAEARERSRGSRTEVKAPLVPGDVVSLSGRIRVLESDVFRIQGDVQMGNANLRECQYKLDATLIREKVLEGEIKAMESLVKRKEELLKDLPAWEKLNAEIGRLRAHVADLEALNLAESATYIAKLEEDVIYHDKVDAEIIKWKNDYASYWHSFGSAGSGSLHLLSTPRRSLEVDRDPWMEEPTEYFTDPLVQSVSLSSDLRAV
ncbi:hypothetical protein GIB67_039496 [Kingdonia uniflora]|uniref:Uncharacterized protein n=1 Tax=Kingdonia uniflora TaxID=39325 RepID=A0A7J7LJ10_9MAGN|nr:hypothetical protein GIB67_039496 [Kingdonia uniflora]